MNARERGRRRDEIIGHATDLLREGGPDALTSVAVARRCGITQSAVYRHIRNVDELTGLASAVIVGELHGVVEAMLTAPDLELGSREDFSRLIGDVTDAMATHAKAFEVVDRWRFSEGALGDGIREVVNEGQGVLEAVLEHRWRVEFGGDAVLSGNDRAAQRAHAQLLHTDAHAVARLVRGPTPPGGRAAIAGILELRVLMAWVTYVADMQRRTGGPPADIPLR